MYIIKTNKFVKNYTKIFDKNGHLLICILIFDILLIGVSNFYKYQPLDLAESYLNIKLWYQKKSHLWSDPYFDVYVPFISSIIICAAFFKDYNTNAYEIMTFYNKGKYNRLVFWKWFTYTSLLVISALISSIISYKFILITPFSYFALFIRFIPPLLYMNGLVLFLLVLCKNVNIAIAISYIYVLVDRITGGMYTKIFTLQSDSFYLKSYQYFYFNRAMLFVMSIIFVFVACKKSSKL